MATNQEIIQAVAMSTGDERLNGLSKLSLESFGNIIVGDGNYQVQKNAFINALINTIAMQIVNQKIIQNPLAELKKGKIPYGAEIQEIIANPAIAETYDFSSTDLLKNKPCDIKAQYYRISRQDKYPVSISDIQLQRAIIREGGLQELINMIISTLYSGDNLHEFKLMKELSVQAYKNKHCKKVVLKEGAYTDNDATLTLEEVTTSNVPLDIIRLLKKYCMNLTFGSDKYNAYFKAEDGKTVTTFTPLEEQAIIITSDMLAKIDVDVLAGTFNLTKAEFMAKVYVVDNFGDTNIYCMLIDKSFLKVYDVLKKMGKPFENGDTLVTKYTLHHHQIMAYCMFANAICFVSSKDKALQPTG